MIARELTKLHEEIIRTTVSDLERVSQQFTLKGEFVIVIGLAKNPKNPIPPAANPPQ